MEGSLNFFFLIFLSVSNFVAILNCKIWNSDKGRCCLCRGIQPLRSFQRPFWISYHGLCCLQCYQLELLGKIVRGFFNIFFFAKHCVYPKFRSMVFVINCSFTRMGLSILVFRDFKQLVLYLNLFLQDTVTVCSQS